MSEPIRVKDKNELKAKIDLPEFIGRYVELKREGNAYCGLSPINSENHGSFYVYPTPQNKYEKYAWKDHSGGQKNVNNSDSGGDVFAFWMYIHGIEPGTGQFNRVLNEVAQAAGFFIAGSKETEEKIKQKQKSKTLLKEYQKILMNNLNENPAVLKNLLDSGLTKEEIKHQGIGLATKNDLLNLKKKGYTKEDYENSGIIKNGKPIFLDKITYPILNGYSEIVSFIGQSTHKKEKFIKGPDTLLFNSEKDIYKPLVNYENSGIENKGKPLFYVITENPIQAISIAEKGYHSVSLTGTEITDKQVEKLTRNTLNVLLMTNGRNEKGINEKLGMQFAKRNAEIRVCEFENGKGPADFFKKYKPEERQSKFLEFIQNSGEFENKKCTQKFFDWKLNKINPDYNSLKGKADVINEIRDFIEINDPFGKNFYINELSKKIKIEPQKLNEVFNEMFEKKQKNIEPTRLLNLNENKKEEREEKILEYNVKDKVSLLEGEMIKQGIREGFLFEIKNEFSEPFFKQIIEKMTYNKENGYNIAKGFNEKEREFIKGQKEFKVTKNKNELLKEHKIAVLEKSIKKDEKILKNAEKELKELMKKKTSSFTQ